ncbi:MAG: master DNA invertase Mpi family serine-type recombinase [Bacteroidales bacterium]|nr:master DNA invertase Mpi family serine-type recombinase [Bacteroidales bacterium]
MNYGYIRVSTDKQSVSNQQFEIETFCAREQLNVDDWIEETISGTKDYEKRKLGGLLRQVRSGDLIICAELSRLGRSLFMIMEILGHCMTVGCRVWSIKEGYRLGDDIQSKVMAFAFGLSAEIERNLISQRTKEALACRKAEGVRLGRPQGALNHNYRIDGHSDEIRRMMAEGLCRTEIARQLGFSTGTVDLWLSRNGILACETLTIL